MSKNVQKEKKPVAPRQLQALAVLAGGGDVMTAAQAAGVDRRTIDRWTAEDGFRSLLVQAETETVRRCSRRLGKLADSALGVLEGVMASDEANDGVRVRAAVACLDVALKWRESVSLADRLEKLEAAISEKNVKGGWK